MSQSTTTSQGPRPLGHFIENNPLHPSQRDLPSFFYFLAIMGGLRTLADSFIVLARLLEWWHVRSPTSKSGTARWAQWRD